MLPFLRNGRTKTSFIRASTLDRANIFPCCVAPTVSSYCKPWSGGLSLAGQRRTLIDRYNHFRRSLSCLNHLDGKKPINARDDTLCGPSMFDHAKQKGRCVVIAEGYVEIGCLRMISKRARIDSTSGNILQTAKRSRITQSARMENWCFLLACTMSHISMVSNSRVLHNFSISDYPTDQTLYTCTIITTEASSFFEFLHDRMPVILENGSPDVDTWLSDEQWGKKHVQIMRPFKGPLE